MATSSDMVTRKPLTDAIKEQMEVDVASTKSAEEKLQKRRAEDDTSADSTTKLKRARAAKVKTASKTTRSRKEPESEQLAESTQGNKGRGQEVKDLSAPALEGQPLEQSRKPSRLGRKATQNVSYKESGTRTLASETVVVKEELTAETEQEAISLLATEAKTFKLLDFTVHDDSNEEQPIDRIKHCNGALWVSGTIYPETGSVSKGFGRKVARFGPLQAWRIAEKESTMQVLIQTPLAEYICIRAAGAYRQTFQHLLEQAEIAHEVQKALDPKASGDPRATFEEAVARLARAKVGKSYFSSREALLLNGNFVISHLKAIDAQTGGGSSLGETPFVAALQEEVSDLDHTGGAHSGGITIKEPSTAPAAAQQAGLSSAEKRSAQADEDYARQLQAKLDVQEARAPHRRAGAKGQAYIKISEAEIAEDYPDPLQYEKTEEETDELLLADDGLFDVDPEVLPRRVLSDFSVYNAEGMMSTLELLPMWGGAEPDVEIFASGTVIDDDGEWAGGQTVEAAGEGSSGGGSLSAEGSSDAGGASGNMGHMRIFSSQIQEWIVEYSCDLLFISIRTDVAWYRLSRPASKYAPWFAVVLKSARLAVRTLTLLSEETRASKLSFADVIKRLTKTPDAEPTFISKKVDAVERFVVVHGQILLNQFQNFPVKAIKNSAFAAALKGRMELCRHAKLYIKPVKPAKARANSNPMRDRASVRAKPMTATATTMVRSIWQSYFPSSMPAGEGEAVAVAPAVEVEEDLNEEDDEAEEENALAEARPAEAAEDEKVTDVQVTWEGAALKKAERVTFYSAAKVGETAVELGDVVALVASDEALQALGLVQALWQTKQGKQSMQIRSVARGSETVLGDAASSDELFVTSHLLTRPLQNVASKLKAERLQRSWTLADRRESMAADDARRERNAAAAAAAEPLEYFYRSLYLPEQGMFCQLPSDFQLGSIAEEEEQPAEGVSLTADGEGLIKDGVTYRMGDFLFLSPGTLDQLEDAAGPSAPVAEYAAKGRFHKGGANAGLRPYGIAQLHKVHSPAEGKQKAKKDVKPSKVEVLRFYRPEDISQQQAYEADFWDIYASNEKLSVDIDAIISKCKVATTQSSDDETFFCSKTFNRADGSFSEAPADFRQKKQGSKGKSTAADKGKGVSDKGKGTATAAPAPTPSRKSTAINDGISLASMDIFAGCGGLTEGLHQAGAAHAKWAIEYEDPAAEAFRLNHPDAVCWAANCNVILTAAMHKAGMADICTASPDAEEQARNMDAPTLASLPLPGEVEFLCGGPPCQGYSGMNRFNKGNWSMVQNSMVMAYLSFADFYRPRYFLLENVRNFVSHNKSFTFRLTLRSLLDMGYQVRFGVLNAGNFGVSQSRKRTFIWAAAPGEQLPEWPQLLHIFRSPQLTINLPGNVKYTAVPQTEGAPLRTVTVKDVISDLPSINNGHALAEMEYEGPAISAFQKKVRGDETVLRDHICKEMNALNLERCRCIPKNQPGADWRVLQQIVEDDPSRTNFQGQPLVPWCLPNTADRHNGWRGLFGRLDWAGHFPTSTTDPQPMGKVGQVFHPDQDRIVSVRECARAQGFPDSFRFYGNVHNRHRQIGNAVPPPLAFSLGKCLRKALEKTAASKQASLLAAQMG